MVRSGADLADRLAVVDLQSLAARHVELHRVEAEPSSTVARR
jgi:hypothetical protein